MNCNHCQRFLHQYLDESPSPRKRASVEKHLRSCHDCREALAQERSFSTSMLELLSQHVEGLKLKAGVQRDVVKALESSAPSPKTHRNYTRVLLRPALALGAAACVLVVAIAVFQNGKLPPTEPVVEHPKSYIMCMATRYADEAKTDWIERRMIVEMRNGIEGYLQIIARKPPKTTQSKKEEQS